MYNLKKNADGDVWYIKKAGSAYVKAAMPEGQAIGIIESSGEIEKSDKFDGFEICVDDGEYYFAGNFKADEEKSEPKEETADKPKNDQNFKNKWKK